jgi:broad specificity phosphatase PhoE
LALRDILDPALTEEGQRQAEQLLRLFQFHENIGAVFSSPLQRALQTAVLAFGPWMPPNARILALPLAQETSEAPCDTGQDIQALNTAFRATNVDFKHLELGWNSKHGRWSQADSAVRQRAEDLKKFLVDRKECEVVLVTHGYFLRYLTDVRTLLFRCGY